MNAGWKLPSSASEATQLHPDTIIPGIPQKRIYRNCESSKVRRMRHTIPLFTVLIILIGCGKGDGEVSELFDPNNAGHMKMEAKVRIKTRKKTGDFTEDDLKKMITLQLPNSQVDDLTPLASMGQLQIVILNNNQITDLKPLSGLTRLKKLDLANNKITDLTPLQTLKGLGDGDFTWLAFLGYRINGL